MLAPGRSIENLLVDGELAGSWWFERDGRRRATLAVRPARALSRAERAERADVEAEAERMAGFAGAEAEVRDVRFEPPAA
jgi:hypothetical protein